MDCLSPDAEHEARFRVEGLPCGKLGRRGAPAHGGGDSLPHRTSRAHQSTLSARLGFIHLCFIAC